MATGTCAIQASQASQTTPKSGEGQQHRQTIIERNKPRDKTSQASKREHKHANPRTTCTHEDYWCV
eukprot:6297562-Heterocapsa_arctica.AAC.1